ncbi:Hypothetical protein At1g04090 [Linum grandiflorum]
MGNYLPLTLTTTRAISSSSPSLLPIDTIFTLPSPLPTWPSSSSSTFATGTIDLGGGLHVSLLTSFTKVWSTSEGGPANLGASFFQPSNLPSGFHPLGSYCHPNNSSFHGWILVAKDDDNDALKPPVDFTLSWSSSTVDLQVKQQTPGYIWLPVPPEGYKPLGHVITTSPDKPHLDSIRCVRSDLTDQCEPHTLIWSSGVASVFTTRPIARGIKEAAVPVGSFMVQPSTGGSTTLACLKNMNYSSQNSVVSLASMPNLEQIEAIFRAYSPRVYFHPKEQYFPCSVDWLFKNGTLLYTKGKESSPEPVQPDGSNLPTGGWNDGEYWLDLPKEKSERERVKKGDVEGARSYLHVKPMFGGTFTDIATWIFYPYNGSARLNVGIIPNIPLPIGQHVGDWEHLTLRVSNFDGQLRSVYFSQHSGGQWVDAPELELEDGNKTVAFSSRNGHAMYPKEGVVMQGSRFGGIRNDAARSSTKLDTAASGFTVVAAEYLGVAEPRWVNYMREWGPKIEYALSKVTLPIKLPKELFGEEGPTGPKAKGNWAGDEVVK